MNLNALVNLSLNQCGKNEVQTAFSANSNKETNLQVALNVGNWATHNTPIGPSFHREQRTKLAKRMHTRKHLPALVQQRSARKTDPVIFANISQPQFTQHQNSKFQPKFLCPLLRSKESFVYRLILNLSFKFWSPCFSSVRRWFPRGLNCHRARGKSAFTRTCGPLLRNKLHRLCFPDRMLVWDMQS